MHFDQLVRKALKTSRAWMLKELAVEMWEQPDREALVHELKESRGVEEQEGRGGSIDRRTSVSAVA